MVAHSAEGEKGEYVENTDCTVELMIPLSGRLLE